MNMNGTLRSRLTSGEPVVATFVMIPRVEVLEMIAVAGYDAVILDLEHGPMGVSQLSALAAFAKAAGIHSIARISEQRSSEIGAVLDAGIDGVMVPHIASANGAAAAVAAAKYPPQGTRSLNAYVRGAGYDGTAPGSLEALNDRVAVIGMLEGRDALDEIDDILATPLLDALFVGPVDLSGELGYPGQPDHPEVVAAVTSVFERCSATGVASGVYASTPDRANEWFAMGASLVAVSADSAMLLESLRATRRGVLPAGGEGGSVG